MGNAEKYRANAHHCQRMADEAFTPEDTLNLAEYGGDLARDDPKGDSERRRKCLRKLSWTKERDNPSPDTDCSG
jgi:hypothetical protein